VGSGPFGTSFVDSISGTNVTTITAGQTVEWQWVSSLHSTTSGTCSATNCTQGPPCSGCSPWNSGILNSGATFTQTFTNTNTYTYFCLVHDIMMQGTIVVNP
jgi:plastocyanin